MFSSPIRTHSLCPNCKEELWLRSAREPVCVACNEPVRIPLSYRRRIFYIAFLVVLIIACATYHRTSAGPWIIGLLLLWVLITFVLSAIVPATYERGETQLQVTFVAAFVGVFISVFTVEFVGFLAACVLLGAAPAEIQEQLDTLSVPLGWFSRQFVIRPEKSFLDACGIMLGNSFLIGIPVFLCVKGVQSVLRRNRAIRIGIDHSDDSTDD